MYTIKRWNGSGWYNSLCSYQTYTEAHEHAKKYPWHYGNGYPYKIAELKEKTKAPKKFVKTNWEGVVIV